MIKKTKKLIAMACGIGLASAVAIPTTLMSSCSKKQEPIIVKFYYSTSGNWINSNSWAILKNGIPVALNPVNSTISFNTKNIEQLKQLEDAGTYKFYFESTYENELKIYTLNEFIIQYARLIAK